MIGPILGIDAPSTVDFDTGHDFSDIRTCQHRRTALATGQSLCETALDQGILDRMSRVERWERRSEIPLLLLALAFLVAYAWPVLDPRLDPDLADALVVLSWTVWVAFAADFAIRLVLAEERSRYALQHWYDVALIALPMLRPLRLLRLLALVRILDRSVGGSLAGRALVYVCGAAAMAVGLGALAVLDAERQSAEANITTIGDALWWASTTVTTVGYGDFYPTTLAGRLVAVLLMVVGIALLGVVTASMASWFLERASEERRKEEPPR
jgi:voltage-gated potassium channel